MTQMNPDQITRTISITVLPQDNGQYVCQILSSLGDLRFSLRRGFANAAALRYRSQDYTDFYGQTKEHAIANALEQLAEDYRSSAEDSQNIDALAVELSDSGAPIEKHYHVILHYERIEKAESKFEATHETILGNTVVEDALISVIEISPDLQINPLTRPWD